MQFEDALKRQVDLPRRPQRIVSLVPSLTEVLFTFGLDQRIVGITSFCVEPAKSVAGKPKVGGTKTLSLETILGLSPDLVIASAEENRQEDISSLLAKGINVYVTLPTTVHEAKELIATLGRITGRTKVAAPIVKGIERALRQLTAADDNTTPPVKVFCPIWRHPWMTVGPGTYTHDLLTACGGENIFTDRWQRYPKVDLAEVSQRGPEVILLPDGPYQFASKHISEIQSYSEIPAVRNGRVHVLDGKHLGWYGTQIAASLRYVRTLLYPGNNK